jgi:hypothetical protein
MLTDKGGMLVRHLPRRPSVIKTRTNLEGRSCQWAVLCSGILCEILTHVSTRLVQYFSSEDNLQDVVSCQILDNCLNRLQTVYKRFVTPGKINGNKNG